MRYDEQLSQLVKLGSDKTDPAILADLLRYTAMTAHALGMHGEEIILARSSADRFVEAAVVHAGLIENEGDWQPGHYANLPFWVVQIQIGVRRYSEEAESMAMQGNQPERAAEIKRVYSEVLRGRPELITTMSELARDLVEDYSNR